MVHGGIDVRDVGMCICIWWYVCLLVYVGGMYLLVCVHVYVDVRVHVYVGTCICTCWYMYVLVYVGACICWYVYVYMLVRV